MSLNLVIGYHKLQEVGGGRPAGRLSSFVRAFHALLDNNAAGAHCAAAQTRSLLHHALDVPHRPGLIPKLPGNPRFAQLNTKNSSVPAPTLRDARRCNSHLRCLVPIRTIFKLKTSTRVPLRVPQSNLYLLKKASGNNIKYVRYASERSHRKLGLRTGWDEAEEKRQV